MGVRVAAAAISESMLGLLGWLWFVYARSISREDRSCAGSA